MKQAISSAWRPIGPSTPGTPTGRSRSQRAHRPARFRCHRRQWRDMSNPAEQHPPPEMPPNTRKPRIDQLLIQSALRPDLCRDLLESPNEIFSDFDLTEEEQAILRKPDSRLLPLLGPALALQTETESPAEASIEVSAP